MKHRLFVAINIPDDIKNGIEVEVDNINLENGRWMPLENWHITVSFLDYQPEEKIPQIIEVIKQTTKSFD